MRPTKKSTSLYIAGVKADDIEAVIAFLKSQHYGDAPVQFSPDQVRKALQEHAKSSSGASNSHG